MQGREWWGEVGRYVNAGAVFDSLRCADIPKFIVRVPPLRDQVNICQILGLLDARIDLNRQTNKILETIAQELFKSWFVNFDPVIDNAMEADNHIPESMQARAAARRALGENGNVLPAEVRRDFPDDFEFRDEVGWVPRGWSIGILSDLLVLQRGFDLPSDLRTQGDYPLAAASGQDGTHSEFRANGPGVVTGRSGRIGVVRLYLEDHWPLNTTLWVKEYRRSNPYHAFHVLKSIGLDRYSSGSAVPTLNRNHVLSLPRVLAPARVLEAFEERCAPIYERVNSSERIQISLGRIRDLLLPKLLSGEITIPDAEKLAADVL